MTNVVEFPKVRRLTAIENEAQKACKSNLTPELLNKLSAASRALRIEQQRLEALNETKGTNDKT